MENEKKWLNVHDVMAITGLSVAAAYKLMREVNAVQKADGKERLLSFHFTRPLILLSALANIKLYFLQVLPACIALVKSTTATLSR